MDYTSLCGSYKRTVSDRQILDSLRVIGNYLQKFRYNYFFELTLNLRQQIALSKLPVLEWLMKHRDQMNPLDKSLLISDLLDHLDVVGASMPNVRHSLTLLARFPQTLLRAFYLLGSGAAVLRSRRICWALRFMLMLHATRGLMLTVSPSQVPEPSLLKSSSSFKKSMKPKDCTYMEPCGFVPSNESQM
jgi:hypothetical protein